MRRRLARLRRATGASFALLCSIARTGKGHEMYLLISFCSVDTLGRSALGVLNPSSGEFWALDVPGNPVACPALQALPHTAGSYLQQSGSRRVCSYLRDPA
jgi:hypothetical protein